MLGMRTHPTVWALALALLAVGGCGDRRDDEAAAIADAERDTHGERGTATTGEMPRTGAIDKNDDDERVVQP